MGLCRISSLLLLDSMTDVCLQIDYLDPIFPKEMAVG
jgi:hypothetical protein